jgi:hypothetical protein
MIFVSPDYRAKTSWMGPKAEADMVQYSSWAVPWVAPPRLPLPPCTRS